jgi:hypothetical protein
MQAYLINTENNKVTANFCRTSDSARGQKADLIILMANAEAVEKNEKEVSTYMVSLGNVPYPQDHVITFTRLISDKLLSLNIYPNTKDFKLC